MPPLNLYARVRFFVHVCTRDRGCSAHPVFPAPSVFKGRRFPENLGRIVPRECEVMLAIGVPSLRGALATKQSILSLRGAMDCFAEPVIGRRFAPTRWLA